MTIDGMAMPPIFAPENSQAAVGTLRAYFRADPAPKFSGSWFERFAGGGDRTETANEFTADDLVAVTLLSVDVPGQAALRILGDHDPAYRDDLSDRLRALPTDVALVDAADEHLAVAEELWSLLRSNRGVGRTKTSKLMARKRPHLLPVINSVVADAVGYDGRNFNFYRGLRAALRADDRRLHDHLLEVRAEAGIGDGISAIRVFDVLVWMWGSGLAEDAR